MTVAALLLAALALAPGEPPAERVAALSLVPAGDQEARRVLTAAGLQPGEPLEPERVRHAVEMLFATGAYHEDGLSVAVDGLGGGWEKGRILVIM